MARILIVDDDDNQRLLYRERLAEEGHDVIEARNGRDALEAVAHDVLDAVVLDINMPGMDGLDTLAGIHNLNRHLPVVLNTAFASYRDQFVSWIADAYVVKSSQVGELCAAVRDVLAKNSGAG